MKILSMTATFGKLEHETLTLEPGLNVLHAPNEWGKSTWCAFLMAMLYGVDTRAKSTKGALSDKEHFAPWSGSPMSGRMDIEWNGRQITLERTSRGRIPMGTFRAYETETCVDVPELTAENCGRMLLGVEQSVYSRAGFVRLRDLPVTQDDALRQRLQALVTTGDESGDAGRLEKGLHELRNRCVGRQKGALSRAEEQREQLRNALLELDSLNKREQETAALLAEREAEQHRLENHMAALAYESAQRDRQRVAEAEKTLAQAKEHLQAQENVCAGLPEKQKIEYRLEALRGLWQELHAFREEQRMFPPRAVEVPKPFLGMSPEEAKEQTDADIHRLKKLRRSVWWLLLIPALLCMGFGGWMLRLGLDGAFRDGWQLYAAAWGGAGLLLLLAALLWKRSVDSSRKALCRKYGSADPADWVQLAEHYAAAEQEYRRADAAFRKRQSELSGRREQIAARRAAVCGAESPDQMQQECYQYLAEWSALEQAREDVRRAESQLNMLRSMVREVPKPGAPDSLTLSREQTMSALKQTRSEQQRLTSLLGECRGQRNALGEEAALREELSRLDGRIAELRKLSDAVALAQETMVRAEESLQRRFAPKLTKRAQELLSRMTGGKYDRLSLGSDLSLRTGGNGENTLWEPVWRSEGTVDQVYLALRLAVAEALSPESPLVLDDALVRFDEERLAAALDILKELSEKRQVLIFTCQHREKAHFQE